MYRMKKIYKKGAQEVEWFIFIDFLAVKVESDGCLQKRVGE
jgi:hypothetical protein